MQLVELHYDSPPACDFRAIKERAQEILEAKLRPIPTPWTRYSFTRNVLSSTRVVRRYLRRLQFSPPSMHRRPRATGKKSSNPGAARTPKSSYADQNNRSWSTSSWRDAATHIIAYQCFMEFCAR